MLETYWNLVLNTGRFWMDGNIRLKVQGSAPATPPSGNYEFYAKSTGLFIKDSAGVEVGPLGGVPATLVTGTGAANKIAYWTGAQTIDDDTDLHWDAANNRLGLSQASPSVQLEMLGTTEALIDIKRADANANGPGMRQYKARGTPASPTLTQGADGLGFLGFGGCGTNGSWAANSAAILGFATSTWSGTNRESHVMIGATPNASVNRENRMQIGGNGNIYFNEVAASPGSIHPTLTTFISQFFRNSTSVAPDLQIANIATGSGSSLGALSWGSRGASASDKRAALIHVALDASGVTNPTGRMEFYVNNAGAFVQAITIKSDGKVGFGTSAPAFGVHASGASPGCHVASNRLSADALGPAFIGQKARGTPGSPTVVLADDQLLQLVGQGFENAAYHTQANIKLFASQNWTGSVKGTYMTFETTTTGGVTISERLRIEASGDISHASGVRHRMLSQNRIRYLNSMASVKQSADQTLTNATVTAINFGAEDIDTDSLHDNSTNNTRITIALTGKYLVGGVLNYIANAAGVRQIRLHLNGSATPIRIAAVPGMSSDNSRPAAVWLVSLTAGDYIELHGYQDRGGDLVVSSGTPNSHFFAEYVGE